jgi:hypothetical protein
MMVELWTRKREMEDEDQNHMEDTSGYCGDGLECGHHVGWFRVVRGRAACTLVLV